jgi:hypothetical protein
MAKSGALIKVTELIPDMSSGREVTDAIIISPNQALPMPDFSAITSPYFESRIPQKIITPAHAKKIKYAAIELKIKKPPQLIAMAFIF